MTDAWCFPYRKKNTKMSRKAILKKYQKVSFEEGDRCFGCQEKFNSFNRRHHCRKCMHSFCGAHSKHKVRLATAPGEKSRVCDSCFKEENERQRKKRGLW